MNFVAVNKYFMKSVNWVYLVTVNKLFLNYFWRIFFIEPGAALSNILKENHKI